VAVTTPPAAAAIFNALPPLQRRVSYGLLGFLARLAAPENVVETKMSVDNLAMVFAPSFLRTPTLELMMTNAALGACVRCYRRCCTLCLPPVGCFSSCCSCAIRIVVLLLIKTPLDVCLTFRFIVYFIALFARIVQRREW